MTASSTIPVVAEHRAPAGPGPGPDAAPMPVSGAWRPEDGPGGRHFASLGALRLESGAVIEDVQMAYETWGTLDTDGGNAVLVLHALTGDSHVRGPAGEGHASAGWWEQMVGPGCPIDTDRWFVIAPNVLGGCQGTTGPSSTAPDGLPWGSRFPRVTVRDQVAAERALREQLGIERWALVIGGSMGGMRAVEWAATHPAEVQRLAVIASAARASADQIAWNSAQTAAIDSDPGFHDGDYYHLPPGQVRTADWASRGASPTPPTAQPRSSRPGSPIVPRGTRTPWTGTDATRSPATSTTTPPSWRAASTRTPT